MRLTELQPEFLKLETDRSSRTGVPIDEADGIIFLCPVCFINNNGKVGTHYIICWRPRVPQSILPGPGRWDFEGTGFTDLTLKAGSSSVLLRGACKAHFFVRDGSIIMC